MRPINEITPGTALNCTIVERTERGYVVYASDGLTGLLLTSSLHSIGDQVSATFVCEQNGIAQFLYRTPFSVFALKRQFPSLSETLALYEDGEIAS